jgi:nicotinamide riboside kinase
MKVAETVFENVRYDLYFYIAPEFDIVPDGIRSENTEFRDRIAELFEEYMLSYKLEAIRLTGTVDQRVTIFTDTLAAYDKWMANEIKEREAYMASVAAPLGN